MVKQINELFINNELKTDERLCVAFKVNQLLEQ